MQEDVEKTVFTTRHLALAYRNFITIIDYICNKYKENEGLLKIRDKTKARFSLFCDAPIECDKTQKEGSVEGAPTINQAQKSNNISMMEAIVELQGAHMEFMKVQVKQ